MRLATRSGLILLLLVALTGIGVGLVPLSTGVRSVASPDTSDFRAFMQPRLAALLEASEEVNSMVSERSRNVLALRAESQRITTLTDQIDAYLETAEIPAWAEPAVADYRAGRDLIMGAIDEAYEALRTFDFSAMPEMVPLFACGTEHIAKALEVLENSAHFPSVVH